MPAESSSYHYRAFISYSHEDERWSRWLIRRLESYRVPRALVGTTNFDGETVPARLGTIFRDRDEAASSSDLGQAIRSALAESRHLIVIASPHAARSRYVDEEIRYFREINAARPTPGKILPLIVAGEPAISIGPETDPQECFPPSLRAAVDALPGGPAAPEPLAADLRPHGDGRARGLAKLIAGLISVRYDSLVRRELRRRQQRRLTFAVSALVVVALGAALAARRHAAPTTCWRPVTAPRP
jgi:hypothetical protein